MKLQDHLNPLVGDVVKLKKEYQTFGNKRPTNVQRGLDRSEEQMMLDSGASLDTM